MLPNMQVQIYEDPLEMQACPLIKWSKIVTYIGDSELGSLTVGRVHESCGTAPEKMECRLNGRMKRRSHFKRRQRAPSKLKSDVGYVTSSYRDVIDSWIMDDRSYNALTNPIYLISSIQRWSPIAAISFLVTCNLISVINPHVLFLDFYLCSFLFLKCLHLLYATKCVCCNFYLFLSLLFLYITN